MGGAVQKGERKRKQVLEKGKGREGSEPKLARGAFEVHAKRSLRGCFSDRLRICPRNVAGTLETRTMEEGKR